MSLYDSVPMFNDQKSTQFEIYCWDFSQAVFPKVFFPRDFSRQFMFILFDTNKLPHRYTRGDDVMGLLGNFGKSVHYKLLTFSTFQYFQFLRIRTTVRNHGPS